MKGSESIEGWFTEAIIEHHADETKLYIAGEVVGLLWAALYWCLNKRFRQAAGVMSCKELISFNLEVSRAGLKIIC